MKGSLIILSFFVAGLFLGLYEFLPQVLMENDYSEYALWVLMFLVGVGIGADRDSLKTLFKANFKILMVPASVVIGSLIGTAVMALFMPEMTLSNSMAVGAGFGYYSLSSIIITKEVGAALGVIALLSNIMREIITLLASPLFAKYFGKIAPIASGGATAMDTTLPIITKFSGKDYAIISVFSGIVLTILVPFLVSFILSFS